MSRQELLVLGGGISGASFAFRAAKAGQDVLLIEKSASVGGCLQSVRTESGYWFEMGAHTCYNSYGAFLQLIEDSGQVDSLLTRGKSVLRFLDGDQPVSGKNLGLLLKLFSKFELLTAIPRWIAPKPSVLTVRDYYSRLVGKRNYERVLGPMLSAVPSQSADEFPSDMLFKKRDRREEMPRSFSVEGGLNSVVDGLVAHSGIEVRTGRTALNVERMQTGFCVTFDDGSSVEADRLALALPPQVVANLVKDSFPEIASQAAKIRQVEVDSLGFATLAEHAKLPYATFFIPLCDSFFSTVTRDVIHDDVRRAFTLHFRPGLSKEERLARAQTITGVKVDQMESISERRIALPSPTLGHSEIVRAIDAQLANQPMAITGNWFSGLAIEDCALRSQLEFDRMNALGK